jgi:hypothetical protein
MTTESNTDTPRRPIGQTLWRYTKILLGVVVGGFLLVHVGCVMSEMGTGERLPRYVYTETRTELVFDGEKIVIEGLTECRRRGGTLSNGESFNFGKPTPYYWCGPRWQAYRPKSGGVLLIARFGVTESWPPLFGKPDLTKPRQILNDQPRAVFWLDDDTNPTRGEYYFSTYAFEQPGSRLASLKTEIVDVHDRTYFRKAVPDPKDEVPWLVAKDKPHALRGYYAILYPKERWSAVDGLEEVLAEFKEPVLVPAIDLLTEDQWKAYLRTLDFTDVTSHSTMRHKSDDPRSKWTNPSKYERSSRIVSLARDASGVYRPDQSVPRGALALFDDPYQSDITLQIGNLEIAESLRGHSGRFLFDPRHGEIIKIGEFSYTVRPH